MECQIRLSTRSAAALLAQIYGPAISDFPRRERKVSIWGDSVCESSGNAEPWYPFLVQPRAMPTDERRVFALADAHIKEFIRLDRLGTMLGGEVASRAIEQALQSMAMIAARCPAWPEWPEGWPVPPGAEPRDQMTPDELLAFGSLLLSASELIGLALLRDALVVLSEDLLQVGMDEEPHVRETIRPSHEPVALHDFRVLATVG